MKRSRTIKQLKEEYKKISSVVSEDTRFIAISLMFIAERMNEISISGVEQQDKLHWLMDFLKDNKLIIGEREGDGFKQISYQELHEIYSNNP